MRARCLADQIVREVVEVVPEPVMTLVAAIGVLSLVLGLGYALTSVRARRLSRQRSDLLQEVGLLQTALLPPVPESVGAVRTSVAYRPSDGPGAGGDFYDAMTLPGGRAAFILGDVSGHGRAALARTAFMRYTLRAYLEAGLDPRTTLQVAGRVIDEHLGGDFATVVLAVHDPRRRLAHLCLRRASGPDRGRPRPPRAGAGRIVSADRAGHAHRAASDHAALPPGSVACLYTDGLAEARTEGASSAGRAWPTSWRTSAATSPPRSYSTTSRARRGSSRMTWRRWCSPQPPASPPAAFAPSSSRWTRTRPADGLAARSSSRPVAWPTRTLASPEAEVRELARAHGGAVLHVEYGIRGPRVDVLPRNVESLEAASRRAAMAIGWDGFPLSGPCPRVYPVGESLRRRLDLQGET